MVSEAAAPLGVWPWEPGPADKHHQGLSRRGSAGGRRFWCAGQAKNSFCPRVRAGRDGGSGVMEE